MLNHRFWELTAKKLSGEASASELNELEQCLKQQPEMHYPLQTVSDIWHQSTPDTEDAHQAFAKHASRMEGLGMPVIPDPAPLYEMPLPNRRRRYGLLALAVLAFIGIAYFPYNYLVATGKTSGKTLADKSEISTRYGSRTNLRLPDGTQVWLNAGSKLSYDKSYGNGQREVSLSGEAYFDVVKNPTLPFVIHTGSIDIKVLGTAFNVKSFPGEKNTETSLIRGSIEVTLHNNPSQKIILKPNQKLITSNEEQPVAVNTAAKQADPLNAKLAAEKKASNSQEPIAQLSHLTYQPHDSTVIETSWMENKLIFRSESFEDLAIKMERWYGVSIRFADESIKPKKLNGVFENETIQQAMKALQLITPFSYKMNKNEILIASK